MRFLSSTLIYAVITYANLRTLNQPRIPGMKPTWIMSHDLLNVSFMTICENFCVCVQRNRFLFFPLHRVLTHLVSGDPGFAE